MTTMTTELRSYQHAVPPDEEENAALLNHVEEENPTTQAEKSKGRFASAAALSVVLLLVLLVALGGNTSDSPTRTSSSSTVPYHASVDQQIYVWEEWKHAMNRQPTLLLVSDSLSVQQEDYGETSSIRPKLHQTWDALQVQAQKAQEWLSDEASQSEEWWQEQEQTARTWWNEESTETKNWFRQNALPKTKESVNKTEAWAKGEEEQVKEWWNNESKETRQWFREHGNAAETWVGQETNTTEHWTKHEEEQVRDWWKHESKETRDSFRKHMHDTETWLGEESNKTSKWFGTEDEKARDWWNHASEETRDWFRKRAHATGDWVGKESNITEEWAGEEEEHTKEWIQDESTATRHWFATETEAIKEWWATATQRFHNRTHTLIHGKEALLYLNDTNAYSMISNGLPHDYFSLQQGLDSQINQAYCPVASAVALLNSFSGQLKLPVDPLYSPYTYATQSDLFNDCTDVNVIYRNESFDGIMMAPGGLSLDQTKGLLQCNLPTDSWTVQAVHLDPSNRTMDEMRESLLAALRSPSARVMINYDRSVIGQVGHGHWSPVGSYSHHKDAFLVMDVAKYRYPAVWIPTTWLYQSMGTLDSCGSWKYPEAQSHLARHLLHPSNPDDMVKTLKRLGCEAAYRGFIVVKKM